MMTSIRPEEFFNGRVKAFGILQLRNGRVSRRFNIDMKGVWDGDHGTLDERFYFDDGEIQDRVWSITKGKEGIYSATATDIVGLASGIYTDNAMQWLYTLRLNVGKRIYNFSFNDWMFSMHDGLVVNRSSMNKFGMNLAELTIILHKE